MSDKMIPTNDDDCPFGPAAVPVSRVPSHGQFADLARERRAERIEEAVDMMKSLILALQLAVDVFERQAAATAAAERCARSFPDDPSSFA
jgi:hypothetical protein